MEREVKLVNVTTYLRMDQVKALDRLARVMKTSRARLIRKAIDDLIKMHRHAPQEGMKGSKK